MGKDSDFLKCFFRTLDDYGVRYCVLRNFDSLPEAAGGDLDLLVHREDLQRARTAAVCCSSTTGFVLDGETPFSPRSLYFRSGRRVLQVDLYTDLSWRGVELLNPELVLSEAGRLREVRVANDAHVAYINLLRRLLLHGHVAGKYSVSIQDTFRAEGQKLERLLGAYLMPSLSRAIVAAASCGDWNRLEGLRSRIARGYLRRDAVKSPWRLVTSSGGYFLRSLLRRSAPGYRGTAHGSGPRISQRRRSLQRYAQGLVFTSAVALTSVTLVSLAQLDAATILVPQEAPSIQAALDRATSGDLVLVSPGIYRENLLLTGKSVTLASYFHATGNRQHISSTVLDGGGGDSAIEIAADAGPGTRLVGLTVRNARDGIRPRSTFELLHSHITATGDAVDVESGTGGAIRHSLLEGNTDDGLDLDRVAAFVIEENVIRANGDDGIEIRLQERGEPTGLIELEGNTIDHNREHGVQVTGRPSGSQRTLRFEGNLFLTNRLAGIHMRGDGGPTADAGRGDEGLTEGVILINNTFVGNDTGVAGGDAVIAYNNLIVASRVGLQEIDERSTVSHTLFWANEHNFVDSNVDLLTSLVSDPQLHEDYSLQIGSPAIDAGFTVGLPFSGEAPDIGAFERDSWVSVEWGG